MLLKEYGHAQGIWASSRNVGMLRECGHAQGMWACSGNVGMLRECEHAQGNVDMLKGMTAENRIIIKK